VVSTWTGLEANALRAAMRLSLRAYAEYLGVSFGTVALWNRRGATVRPTPDMQAVLDTALARSSPEVRQRFEAVTRAAVVASGSGVFDPGDRGDVPVGPSVLAADRGPVALAGSAFAGDERANELFVRGYGLLGANDRQQIETAQALLQRAVNRDPHFARAIAARGYTRWRQYFAGWTTRPQALTDAFRDVDAALDVDPGSVVAHMTFIRACWDVGWHERALAAGRSIHERSPDSLDATVAFARALNNAGLAQHALPLIASVLAVDPTNPGAVKLNVWCHLMVGNHARTMTVSREYLKRTPADANTRWAVALAAVNLPGGGAEAIRTAGDGLKADPCDVTLWVLLGYLHRLGGDDSRARQAWSRGLDRVGAKSAGSNPRTRAWLANLLAGMGEVDTAMRFAAELTDADPHNGYLRYRLAHVLAEAGRSDEAVEMLGSAVAKGFLSAQLLRQEETLALTPLRGIEGFADVLRDLDTRVEDCQRMYAADLPTLTPAAGPVRDGGTT
jgi:tetratricopeptide (TPR) repeat protein